MSSPTPPGLPGAKKTNPLVWIIGGVVVLMFGVMLTCGVAGFLAFRAVKNAGFDPELMERNPGLAMAKMAGVLHPGYQIVSTNERTGTITMREKSSGKVMTFKFDPEKKTLVMSDEDGKQVKITGDDKAGSVAIESGDGTVRFGAGAGSKAPAWAPVYPGSSAEGTYSAQTADGDQYSFSFKTKDGAAKVISYYQDQLKSTGFAVTVISSSDQGGMVQGTDDTRKRMVLVTVGASDEGTQASVMLTEKK
jgi:hypothetical protein